MKKVKKEYTLVMVKANNMFDVEELINAEPEIFDELIRKYPLKKCVYLIENIDKPLEVKADETPVEEAEPITEPSTDNESSISKNEEINIEAPKVEPAKEEYPENFKPLYSIGEKLKISYAFGEKEETISIFNIMPKKKDGVIIGYYYQYSVLESGEIKCMAEDFLTEHEVLNA